MSGGAGKVDGNDYFAGGDGIDTVSTTALNTSATTVDLTTPAARDAAATGAWVRCDSSVRAERDRERDPRLRQRHVHRNGVQQHGVAERRAEHSAGNGGAVGGIDTVNYNMGYKAGVTINLAGGGPVVATRTRSPGS